MARVRSTITGRVEATLFLDPSDFIGLNDLDAIIAVQRELGNGAMWDDAEVAGTADTLMKSARAIARENGGG